MCWTDKLKLATDVAAAENNAVRREAVLLSELDRLGYHVNVVSTEMKNFLKRGRDTYIKAQENKFWAGMREIIKFCARDDTPTLRKEHCVEMMAKKGVDFETLHISLRHDIEDKLEEAASSIRGTKVCDWVFRPQGHLPGAPRGFKGQISAFA